MITIHYLMLAKKYGLTIEINFERSNALNHTSVVFLLW